MNWFFEAGLLFSVLDSLIKGGFLMVNGRIVVVLTRDKETDALRFEFPEEEDRALACFKLAEYALEDERNKKYKGDIGYIRNLFLGVTYKQLYRVWFEPDELMCFSFRSPDYPTDEETIVLKRKTEEIKFIISEEEQK